MKHKTALVVDNERVLVQMLARILEEQGFQVERAYGGLEALAKLKEKTFDIVFLDLIMPRVGGDRICKFIKQSPAHAQAKVVIVTAVAIEAERTIAQLRPDACIAKGPYPKLRENIIKALALIRDAAHDQDDMILGKDGIFSRTVVKELIFAQRHFEAILNNMTEGVIELDTDNIITYLNPAAQAVLGKQEWELIGRSFAEGFQPAQAAEILSVLKELSQTDASTNKELLLSYAGREYSLSLRNVMRDGELIGSTVVVTDITERKLLERERYLRERLTGVMEMAGAAAHELNQPLAVISGHCQLLLKDSASCDEKLSRRIKIILEQVDRLGELTKKFSSIVAYKTKDYGKHITIVDVEESSRPDSKGGLKGFWE